MGRPLLHFALLGLLLWAVQGYWDHRHRGTVVIAAADIAQLREQLTRQARQPPDAAQLQAGIRQRIDEELMLAEALRWDLHRHDEVTRQRLLKNLRFAWPDAGDDPDALLELATALDMPRRDPVARGRLLQLMQTHLVGHVAVTPQALEDYRARHAERYQPAPRLTLEQLFFRAERADARADALAALRQLADDPDRRDLGDPFVRGHRFEAVSAGELRGIFGPSFADRAEQASNAEWRGPVSSPYGFHLLRVTRLAAPATPSLASDAGLRAALEPELRSQALREALHRLRRYYRIEVASS